MTELALGNSFCDATCSAAIHTFHYQQGGQAERQRSGGDLTSRISRFVGCGAGANFPAT